VLISVSFGVQCKGYGQWTPGMVDPGNGGPEPFGVAGVCRLVPAKGKNGKGSR